MLFSKEGDIQVVPKAQLADGTVLYDIAITYDENALSQIVYNRIKTQAPDWFLHPTLGSNLEDLIGEPNSKLTAVRGEGMIMQVLTYDNLLNANAVSVKGIPTAHDTIVFIITVTVRGTRNIVIPVTFNLYTGISS